MNHHSQEKWRKWRMPSVFRARYQRRLGSSLCSSLDCRIFSLLECPASHAKEWQDDSSQVEPNNNDLIDVWCHTSLWGRRTLKHGWHFLWSESSECESE